MELYIYIFSVWVKVNANATVGSQQFNDNKP